MTIMQHLPVPGAIYFLIGILAGCTPPASHDVIVTGGTVHDGRGGEPYVADIAVDDDTVVAIGDLRDAKAALGIDAAGVDTTRIR